MNDDRDQGTTHGKPDLVSPWHPMTLPIDLKHLGKLAEELNECAAAVARCTIQGIYEKEPVTGKPNNQWLEEEIADVMANIELVITHFDLCRAAIEERARVKEVRLKRWHQMLDDE